MSFICFIDGYFLLWFLLIQLGFFSNEQLYWFLKWCFKWSSLKTKKKKKRKKKKKMKLTHERFLKSQSPWKPFFDKLFEYNVLLVDSLYSNKYHGIVIYLQCMLTCLHNDWMVESLVTILKCCVALLDQSQRWNFHIELWNLSKMKYIWYSGLREMGKRLLMSNTT